MPTRARAVIALGSNIAPELHLPRALRMLEESERVLALSRVYETEPVGAPGTPRFLNAAVLVETRRPAAELRQRLREIESCLGRVRTEDRNAPRPIDLDIALIEGRVVERPAEGLRVPDPELLERPHVAYPAGEAAPRLRHPQDGRTLAEIAGALGAPGTVRELRGWAIRRRRRSPRGTAKAGGGW